MRSLPIIASAVSILFLTGAAPAAPARAALADAAEKMERAQIRALIRQHVDINAPQPAGMPPLHWATYHDDLDIAQLLVRSGPSVKPASRYGVTPLSLACTNGN